MKKALMIIISCLLLLTACGEQEIENSEDPAKTSLHGLNWSRRVDTLNGYSIYELDLEENEVLCDPVFVFSVIYEDNGFYYTTNDLREPTGCVYSYKLYFDGDLISFTEALSMELVTVEQIEEYVKHLTVTERVKVDIDNITKFEITTYKDDVEQDTKISTSDYRLERMESLLKDSYFKLYEGETGDFLFEVTIYNEEQTTKLLVYEDVVRIKDTDYFYLTSESVFFDLIFDLELWAK